MLQIVIAYALWMIFVISWNVFAERTATVATPGAHRQRLYEVVIAFGLVTIVLAPFLLVRRAFQIWVNPPLLAWALLAVVLAGIAWCWWARRHLGALWSDRVTRKDGQRIVDSGPYRLVRHPIYTGFIAMYAGLALLTGSALGLAGFGLMTTGLWQKARLEEEFLSEEIGVADYGDYKARTPMLVPRLLSRRV